MSEELRRGIPKAIPTGKEVIFTEEEKRKHEEDFEKILKQFGVLKENESIKDWKKYTDFLYERNIYVEEIEIVEL